MSKIISIEETSFSMKSPSYNFNQNYDGWIITTEDDVIKVGISNSQDCCENWGYVTTMDDPNEFVGSNLINMKITDTALKEIDIPSGSECSVMFVTFSTNKGDFQLVTYNDHNGYYGHDSVVVSKELNHSEVL